MPPVPPDPDQEIDDRFARRLANWVHGFELLTGTVVVFTLLVSIYALSGRLILANGKQMAEAWTKLDTLVEAQEDKTFQPPKLPLADNADFGVSPLCDLVRRDLGRVQLAAAEPTSVSDGASKPETSEKPRYLTARQAHLCDQRAKVLQDLYIVTMHQRCPETLLGPA